MQERFGIIVLSPTQNGLKKIQLEAARIVTGLTSYASLLSIYKEMGWEKLSVRREKRKLSLLYDIVRGPSPEMYYLLRWVKPITMTYETLKFFFPKYH